MSARDRFAQWVIARSGILGVSVAEDVRIRDGLRLSVERSNNGVSELRDGESESGEPSGSIGELTLRESRGVLCLERMPLGVHEAVDVGNGVFGGGHVDEPNDDCTGCHELRAARDAWLAVAS